MNRDARVLELLKVAASGRREREVATALRARERPLAARERPRGHAPHRVLAGERRARGRTGLVQPLRGDDVDVRGELKDRVLRGVQDQRAGARVIGAELLEGRSAARARARLP